MARVVRHPLLPMPSGHVLGVTLRTMCGELMGGDTVFRLLRRIGALSGVMVLLAAGSAWPDHATVRQASAASVVGTSAFVPLTPQRLVDTRTGVGAPVGAVAANTTATYQITGAVVPAAASAVVVNVTATRSQAGGWLQVFPTGRATVGATSTLNLDFAGQTIPNASFAPLGEGGQLSVHTTFTTDVLIDVFGYFLPAAESSAGRFIPVTPGRILDTRSGIGWTPPTTQPPGTTPPGTTPPATTPPPGIPANPGDSKNCGDFATYAAAKAWFDTYYPYYGDVARLDQDGDLIPCESLPGAPLSALMLEANVSGGTTVRLKVTGLKGVPETGVSSVVLNVTVADPAGDGWVQVAPSPVVIGASSNLNTAKGRTIANLVVVQVGSGGQVDFYSTTGGDLLADVVGYFTDSTAPMSAAGLFVPITPDRQLDTRQPSPKAALAAGTITGIDVSDIAPNASAIAGNLTASAAAPGGWMQLSPTPIAVGAASNLNTAYADQTIANAVVSPVGSGTQLQVYTYLSAHLLLDVTGWFTGPTSTPPAEVATAITQLASLAASTATVGIPYNRDDWLTSWADADGDCQNTRTEVLIAEADGPLTYGPGNCTVTAGIWNDPYTGLTFTNPADLDIDHLVPLSDAHRSSGWQWSTAQKHAYANDLTHPETLIAVDDGTNSSKGDKSPDQWMPPSPMFRCTYAVMWISVKASWTLTVTAAERQALTNTLTTC